MNAWALKMKTLYTDIYWNLLPSTSSIFKTRRVTVVSNFEPLTYEPSAHITGRECELWIIFKKLRTFQLCLVYCITSPRSIYFLGQPWKHYMISIVDYLYSTDIY